MGETSVKRYERVIGYLAAAIGEQAGESLRLAIVLMVWLPGLAAAVVANISFTVAALPIAAVLGAPTHAGQNAVIYWALILGADLGGNTIYLGSAPNIVVVRLLARAGSRLSFGRFMRDGAPVALVTLLLSTAWLRVPERALARALGGMGRILCATRPGWPRWAAFR